MGRVAEFAPAVGYGGDGATGGRGPTGPPEENAAAEVSGGRDQLKNVCLNEIYQLTFSLLELHTLGESSSMLKCCV